MSPGQQITALYVDTCIESGRPEMVPMKGHVARRAADLLNDGVPFEKACATVVEFVRRRGRSALQLAEIYAEMEREGGPVSERPSVRRATREWIAENGWPTGATFVRGTHSGSFVYDPLGLDRVTEHDWPHRKPTFDDIVEAIAERSL